MKQEPTTERTADPPDTALETEQLIGATLVVGLLAAIVAFGLLTWLAREMLRGETAEFDAWVRAGLNGIATPGLTALMRFASQFGGPSWLGIIGVPVVLGFLIKRWYRGVVLLAVALGGAGLLDVLLKQVFGRARPTPFFDYPLPSSHSFPSGHALFAFVFFGTFAALLMQRVAGLPARLAIWTVAMLIVALVGTSRVYFGVHYPSDVIAGYLTALVWVVVVAFGDRLASRGVFRRWLLRRR